MMYHYELSISDSFDPKGKWQSCGYYETMTDVYWELEHVCDEVKLYTPMNPDIIYGKAKYMCDDSTIIEFTFLGVKKVKLRKEDPKWMKIISKLPIFKEAF